jgi:hypothetical protein
MPEHNGAMRPKKKKQMARILEGVRCTGKFRVAKFQNGYPTSMIKSYYLWPELIDTGYYQLHVYFVHKLASI